MSGGIPYRVLMNSVSRETCSQIVTEALQACRDGGTDEAKSLRLVLNKRKIEGYRSLLKAPLRLQATRVAELVSRADSLWGFILTAWVAERVELRDKMTAYLDGRDESMPTDPLTPNGFGDAIEMSTADRLVEELLQQEPNLSREEALVMLACLTGKAPLNEDQMAEFTPALQQAADQPELAPRWRALLDELEALDAASSDWDSSSQFAALFCSLVLRKQEAGESEAIRTQLRGALVALVQQHHDALKYFGIADAPGWSAAECAAGDLQKALAKVNELAEKLGEYEQLAANPPTSFAEEQEQYAAKQLLQQQVTEIAGALREPFPRPSGPTDGTATEDGGGDDSADANLPADSQDGAVTTEPYIPDEPTPEEQPEDVTEVIEPPDSDVAPEEKMAAAGLDVEVAAETTEAEVHEPAPELDAEHHSDVITPVDDATASATAESQSDFSTDSGPSEAQARFPAAVPEVAKIVLQDPSPAAWEHLTWSLLAEGDYAAAYWIAKSADTAARGVTVPSWLMQALVGSSWLPMDQPGTAEQLYSILREHAELPDDPHLRLVGLAAALRPAILLPASGLQAWLWAPPSYTGLQRLVRAIDDFSRFGIRLSASELREPARKEELEADLQHLAETAKDWLGRVAPAKRGNLYRANNVWRKVTAPDGEIGALLGHVASDARECLHEARTSSQRLSDESYLKERFTETDRLLAGENRRPITGSAMQHLLRNAREAVDLAEQWCDLLERCNQISAQGDWRAEQIQALRQALLTEINEAQSDVFTMGLGQDQASSQAVVACLSRSLSQLGNLVGIELDPYGAHNHGWAGLASGAGTLEVVMRRRLYWLPELMLDDEGCPQAEDMATIGKTLIISLAEKRTIGHAIGKWTENQDFRFIKDALHLAGDGRDALHQATDAAAQSARQILRRRIDEVSQIVEQAVLDGIVGDDRAGLLSDIEDIDPNAVASFAPYYERLDRVGAQVHDARAARLDELRGLWAKIRADLNDLDWPSGKWTQVCDMVESALAAGDTRVVDEALAQLRGAVEQGETLDLGLFAPERKPPSVHEFLELADEISKELDRKGDLTAVADSIKSKQGWAGMAFAQVPNRRCREAAHVIAEWQTLKRRRGTQDCSRHVVHIAHYLGFAVDDRRMEVVAYERDWAHVRASITDSGLARPIPQFGSGAEVALDIVCVWDRPGPETAVSIMERLGLHSHSSLVLYLGRLTPQQRRYLTAKCRDARMSLAVLDETLLLFLAKEHDARLPAFLRCSLPFSALNPYTPFQAGDVPPEMFYGRGDMIEELQRPSGTCIVFGGRQLGKSALLRQVERRFHSPENQRYARVVNLKLVYDPVRGKSTESVLWSFRETLKDLGILSSHVTTDDRALIVKNIANAMQDVPDRRVLVLYDEADEFLDQDAQDGFPAVSMFRQIMEDTSRRVKVCFAGLHSVQRFQSIPNQPLAHFGAPICVGPLEPHAANQLVREPFETLGYRFEDDATFLRVLSYTNYHPGLIQYYCQELLANLRKKDDYPPPFLIRRSDVEAVYRGRDVRDRIKERFEWTLALDPRYQLIVWGVIADQVESRDSYVTEYTASEVSGIVHYYWSDSLQRIQADELAGLLNELCGLGVLVRTRSGRYRLRSPNIVRLMGTEGEIEDKLVDLASRPVPERPRADELHGPLRGTRVGNPFTYSQERELGQLRSGVKLIYGSSAAGLDAVPLALDAQRRDDLRQVEVPPNLEPDFLESWLRDRLAEDRRTQRWRFLLQPSASTASALQRMVANGIEFCEDYEGRERWLVQVLFIFSPSCTWLWLADDHQPRRAMEDRVAPLIHLRRWSGAAITACLERLGMLADARTCEALMRTTSGWHSLLEKVLLTSGKEDDPTPAALQVEHELATLDSDSCRELVEDLGIGVDKSVVRVATELGRWKGQDVPYDLRGLSRDTGLPEAEVTRAVEFLDRMSCLVRLRDRIVVDGLLSCLMPLS
ncbi:MAG: hypothetical protein ACOX2R_00890 [Anaerolineae bacterium]|jgi:hypothetical protein